MAYLEDLGCLGTALVELLGGEVGFKVMDGFEVVLVDEFTLVLMDVKGFFFFLGGGAGALREPIDSNRSFPVMLSLRIFLAACETATHTRFQIQCVLLGVRAANSRLGDLNNHVCYKFSELFGSKS